VYFSTVFHSTESAHLSSQYYAMNTSVQTCIPSAHGTWAGFDNDYIWLLNHLLIRLIIILSMLIQRFNAVLLHGCFVDEVAGHSS